MAERPMGLVRSLWRQKRPTLSVPLFVSTAPSARGPRVTHASFGRLPDGREATLFTLHVASGASLSLTDVGGIVTALRVPDRMGALGDVVLGFASVEDYTSEAYAAANPHIGGLIGRYANRIARGRFTLDGDTHVLAQNEGDNHIHGGLLGFDAHPWDVEPFATPEASGVRLSRTSPDGEEGYPGTLLVSVTYTFTNDHRWIIDYRATTDAPTVVNLTQHSYFNLGGDPSQPVLDHEIAIHADAFLPVDSASIPTGAIEDVTGTPFDLRSPVPLAKRVHQPHPQLKQAGGFDHTFVLAEGGLHKAARVLHPESGRTLTVETTEPGVQLYTANALDGSLVGKHGARYGAHAAFCLETQNWPDAPNQAGFPPAVLRPGETYVSQTVYAFGAE